MKVTWKRILFGLIISGIFIYLTVRGLDWEHVFESLKKLKPLYFLLAVLFTFVAMFFRGVRWSFLIRPYKKISSVYLFLIELIGYMVNYLLPGKLGEIVKAYVVGEDEGLSKGIIFGTVVIERLLDLSFILLLGIFLPGRLKSKVNVIGKISTGSLILLLVVIVGIFILHLFRERIKGEDSKGMKGKIIKALKRFSQGLDVAGRPETIILSFLITIPVWFFTFLQLYVLMPGMNLNPDYSLALFAMFLFTLGITIPSSPGDIGPFHYFITLALFAGGIDWNRAFAFAVIYHLSQFITVVPSGIIISIKKGITWKEVK